RRKRPDFLTPPEALPRISRWSTPGAPHLKGGTMKIKALVISALLLALGAATSPALAQNRSESWEFGPYFVYFGFDGATEIQDDWGGGFRVGYNFAPMHELEFAFEQVDTQDNVFHDIDVRVRQFQTNYNFNFIFDRHQTVIPYFTAGLGAIKFHVQQT